MTSPTLPPHQDPVRHDDPNRVTMIEYVTTLIAQQDRRHTELNQALKESVAQRFADTDLRYRVRFDAQQAAIGKAEAANERRLEGVNEFRGALTDYTATLMPRSEAETRISALSDKIDDLKSGAAEGSGRSAGLNAGWLYLVGAIAAVSALANILLALRA